MHKVLFFWLFDLNFINKFYLTKIIKYRNINVTKMSPKIHFFFALFMRELLIFIHKSISCIFA